MFGYAAYAIPLAGSGNGFIPRSSSSVIVVDATEEAVKRRLLDHLRKMGVKPCAFKHMTSQCDYSGARGNPSRRPVQATQSSNADRWRDRKGRETGKKTAGRKVTKPILPKREEEPIDYSE